MSLQTFVPAEAPVAGQTLPQAYYVSPEIFELDLERVFARSWLLIGAEVELPRPGDTLTWTVGHDSGLVTRADDGALHAHHNVCRHRGCRLQPDGVRTARVVVCPYHQWAYGMDGALRGAPHMGPDLDRAALSLRPVHLRRLAGLLFVCFAADPPPFDDAVAAIGPQLRPHRIDRTRVAARRRWTVRANWKQLVENNRECYHCRANHPEFCQSNYDLGSAGDSRTTSAYRTTLAEHRQRWAAQGLAPREVSFDDGGWFRVARLPLKDGYVTESLSGRLVAPMLADVPSVDVGSLRIVTLPNSWSHANADYAMTTRLTPRNAGTTDIDVTFLVHEDAVEGVDYDIDELTTVWVATSEQDWELCEQNYAGVRSRGYVPGPLSPVTEGSVAVFHEWYRSALADRSPG